jgi:predicted metal-binding membrane protein
MMLPSFVPMLARYRRAVGGVSEPRLGRLSAIVGAGYFLVWAAFGAVVYPLGVALAALEMQHEALSLSAPVAAGAVVVAAGLLQLTDWKTRHLHCCRSSPPSHRALYADVTTAWRHGVRLGVHCSYCCAGFVAILLVVGVMDLAAMAVVTAAITVERVAPGGERIARATGIATVVAGALLLARALA